MAMANLRGVHALMPVHIATVGHTGKDESRGQRGSNATKGDADVEVQISGSDAVKSVKVIKANDQPERTLANFILGPYEIGRDDDGDPITVAIIGAGEVAAQPTIKGKVIKGAKKIALDLLRKAIIEVGKPAPASNHIPPGTRTILLEEWRRYAYLGAITESDEPDSKRKAFVRSQKDLLGAGLIGIWDKYVWIIE